MDRNRQPWMLQWRYIMGWARVEASDDEFGDDM